jgi:Ca2+-binding EF-hand superfamily protein
VAFDIFDSNQDDKITELDLFKITYQFNNGSFEKEFEKIFHDDICQITKEFNKNWTKKFKQILHENNYDELYVQRMLNWRNLQIQDPNFDKRK